MPLAHLGRPCCLALPSSTLLAASVAPLQHQEAPAARLLADTDGLPTNTTTHVLARRSSPARLQKHLIGLASQHVAHGVGGLLLLRLLAQGAVGDPKIQSVGNQQRAEVLGLTVYWCSCAARALGSACVSQSFEHRVQADSWAGQVAGFRRVRAHEAGPSLVSMALDVALRQLQAFQAIPPPHPGSRLGTPVTVAPREYAHPRAYQACAVPGSTWTRISSTMPKKHIAPKSDPSTS